MSSSILLTEEEIIQRLSEIPLWIRKDNTLIREFVAPNFVSAIGFVNSIAILAEKFDHHPDIFMYGWNKIRLTFTTHSAGGLTEKDFVLAKEVDNLFFFK